MVTIRVFEELKRDLTDESNKQDTRNVMENSLDVSLSKNDTYIFEQGAKSPHSACVVHISQKMEEKKFLNGFLEAIQRKNTD